MTGEGYSVIMAMAKSSPVACAYIRHLTRVGRVKPCASKSEHAIPLRPAVRAQQSIGQWEAHTRVAVFEANGHRLALGEHAHAALPEPFLKAPFRSPACDYTIATRMIKLARKWQVRGNVMRRQIVDEGCWGEIPPLWQHMLVPNPKSPYLYPRLEVRGGIWYTYTSGLTRITLSYSSMVADRADVACASARPCYPLGNGFPHNLRILLVLSLSPSLGRENVLCCLQRPP